MKAGGMDTAKAASPDRLFNFFDAPISLVDHEETYFETAMICRDYKGSGQDKVIAVYRWGWVDYGTRFKPRWDATATRLEVSVVPFVSDEFKSILQAEYATYAANFIPDAE